MVSLRQVIISEIYMEMMKKWTSFPIKLKPLETNIVYEIRLLTYNTFLQMFNVRVFTNLLQKRRMHSLKQSQLA